MLGTVLKRAGGLGLGTALGQGAVLLATPWLVRLYGPANFGMLALLITATNISIAVGCARFDLALPSADDVDAPTLLRLCALIAGAAGLLVAIIAALLAFVGAVGGIANHPFQLGLCVLFGANFQAASSMMLRRGHIRAMAALRGGQGLAFVVLALFPSIGLMWAQALSYAPGCLILAAMLARHRHGPSLAATAARYRSFALLGLPGAILDVVGYSLCIWIVTYAYGTEGSGAFSQVQRIVGAPLMLVSISLGQILLRDTAVLRDDLPKVQLLLKRLLMMLAGSACAALIVVAAVGEPVLGWLFGSQWRISAAFIVGISAAVFIRASISPISAVLATFQRFDLALRWQVLYFVSAATLFGLASRMLTLDGFAAFYAVHEIILYLIYLRVIMTVFRKA